MPAITEFLEARIAEDEEMASEIAACESHDPDGQGYAGTIMQMEGSRPYGVIAVDPFRVLAECAAKRAILAMHETCDDVSYGDASTCPETRTLAAIYANHPDYQQEWAA